MNLKRIHPIWLILAMIGTLLSIRILYSGSGRYLFLVWNLFLAYVPFAISSLFRTTRPKWQSAILLAGWLLFFPNALYVISDLMHIKPIEPIPLWFDVLIMFSSALAGLILGFMSLAKAVRYTRELLNMNYPNLISVVYIFLGSWGIYLGRVERWNSWDIVTNPGGLITEICSMILNPVDHRQNWTMILVYTFVSFMILMSCNLLRRRMAAEDTR